jgi:hypothetical protein
LFGLELRLELLEKACWILGVELQHLVSPVRQDAPARKSSWGEFWKEQGSTWRRTRVSLLMSRGIRALSPRK